MKASILILILISLSNVYAISDNFELKSLTSENKLLIKKSINASGKKTVYFQGGAIKDKASLNKSKLYCSLENVRNKVNPILLKTSDIFKFDNNDFVRNKNFISIRIWKKSWFFGWDNGDVQVITCDATAQFFERDVVKTITYNDFKSVVGPYLEIK